MKKINFTGSLLLMMFGLVSPLNAADYAIDIKGAHAFIQFKIKHLGYSWLVGRFNKFDGKFSYDEKKPAATKVLVNIDTSSIDSNHAERDKHLRGKEFLNVGKFPTAKFVSSAYEVSSKGKGKLKGHLTLHGVTKLITIEVEHIGHGADPWGGYRSGFQGSVNLTLKDFGINYNLGPASKVVQMFLSVEGIRKKKI
ncbi:Protein yceI precursor [hydrothermal vent metagenome]|uniref:Protein yceI n=1 Tax=hydrothermal vent metagenome TaxID=652676 RepID=A0A3B0XSQ1_9ZZZZ